MIADDALLFAFLRIWSILLSLLLYQLSAQFQSLNIILYTVAIGRGIVFCLLFCEFVRYEQLNGYGHTNIYEQLTVKIHTSHGPNHIGTEKFGFSVTFGNEILNLIIMLRICTRPYQSHSICIAQFFLLQFACFNKPTDPSQCSSVSVYSIWEKKSTQIDETIESNSNDIGFIQLNVGGAKTNFTFIECDAFENNAHKHFEHSIEFEKVVSTHF